jgi:hypothetical protein
MHLERWGNFDTKLNMKKMYICADMIKHLFTKHTIVANYLKKIICY